MTFVIGRVVLLFSLAVGVAFLGCLSILFHIQTGAENQETRMEEEAAPADTRNNTTTAVRPIVDPYLEETLTHKYLDLPVDAHFTKPRSGLQEGEQGTKLKYIALIAERHTGSTWLLSFLSDYFKGKDVKVLPTLCTWKHWFQHRIHQEIQDGKRQCRKGQPCPACLDIEHTLVVAMWRNPYDWVSGMYRRPHHAKSHEGIADIGKFLTMRWMLEPKREEESRREALDKAKTKERCMDNFLPWEVVPCRSGDWDSIYELDPQGEIYDNIYELRKAKIADFNAVQEWAPQYERILYEDMISEDGLRGWLQSLETRYGLSGNYLEVPQIHLAKMMAIKQKEMYYTNREHCAPACVIGRENGAKALEILHGMWDAELEASLGYHKIAA